MLRRLASELDPLTYWLTRFLSTWTRVLRLLAGGPEPPTYWLTRFLLLRFVGFVYLIAFLALAHQVKPLIGENGLLPVGRLLEAVQTRYGAGLAPFVELPSVFWLGSSDTVLQFAAYVGIAVSVAVMLGYANVALMALLWALYLSFVGIGQIFYGYGWENLLLETGFLAIFLCPLLRGRPFPGGTPPPTAVVWLLRWLLFRLIFGAGLIKLRGDPCWQDLTCLLYHYETQPLPNLLSWYLHQLPPWFHKTGVLWTHIVQLVVPWMVFGPRRVRHLAGLLMVAFQVTLILSGNLSWLNWLTIAICVSCFDDSAFGRWLPKAIRARVHDLAVRARPTQGQRWVIYLLTGLVLLLSVQPTLNLLSESQIMNTSFDPLRIVNTYGAFGSVGRTRREVILQGTNDETIEDDTVWLEYEFKCKPGDVDRRPCIVSPYHYRVDWQIWFAAMADYQRNPWLVHLVYKLLLGDESTLSLLANNPFPDIPPRFVRAELYTYEFTSRGEPTNAYWKRKRVRPYLPPVSTDNPSLLRYVQAHGWPTRANPP